MERRGRAESDENRTWFRVRMLAHEWALLAVTDQDTDQGTIQDKSLIHKEKGQDTLQDTMQDTVHVTDHDTDHVQRLIMTSRQERRDGEGITTESTENTEREEWESEIDSRQERQEHKERVLQMGRSVVSVVTLCLTSHRNGNFPHFTLTYPLESFADIRNPWLNKRPPVRAQNNQGQFSAAQVLLIRHVLICGNDDFIPSFLSPIQQGAIV